MSDKQRIFNPLRLLPGRTRGSRPEKPWPIVSLAGHHNPNFENEFTKYRAKGARLRAVLRRGINTEKPCCFHPRVFWAKLGPILRTF